MGGDKKELMNKRISHRSGTEISLNSKVKSGKNGTKNSLDYLNTQSGIVYNLIALNCSLVLDHYFLNFRKFMFK